MALRMSVVPAKVGKGKYRLAVQPGRRRSFDQFLTNAVTGTTLTRADIIGVLTEAAEWIVYCAAEGRTCDLGPLGGSYLGARGTFQKRPKQLRAGDYKLTVSWRLSPEINRRLRQLLAESKKQRVLEQPRLPVIIRVQALVGSTRWRDNVYLAGGILKLSGDRLKFDPEREDEGVFLKARGSRGVRVQEYVDVVPKSVSCVVPQSLAGSGPVHLEVRRREQADDPRPAKAPYGEILKEQRQ